MRYTFLFRLSPYFRRCPLKNDEIQIKKKYLNDFNQLIKFEQMLNEKCNWQKILVTAIIYAIRNLQPLIVYSRTANGQLKNETQIRSEILVAKRHHKLHAIGPLHIKRNSVQLQTKDYELTHAQLRQLSSNLKTFRNLEQSENIKSKLLIRRRWRQLFMFTLVRM